MSKVTNLPEVTTLDDDDVIYTVDVSEGTNGSRKIKKSNLKTTVAQDASEVPYDNTDSSLTSTNVKSAIDEIDEDLVDHLDGTASKHKASEIDYQRDDLQKKSIQTGSDNLEEAITDLDDRKLPTNGSQAMTGNLDVGGNNINNVGTVDGRNVSVDGAKLDTIETNAKDDQSAAEVPFDNIGTPYTATNVQNALTEASSIFNKPNVVTVSKNPGIGEFSSVKAAIDSITTAGQSNPFVVKIGPGIFVEDTITLKPYVSVVGENDESTIIEANNQFDSVFIGSENSELKFLQVRGSTGSNTAAIYYQGTQLSDAAFSIIDCSFGSSHTLIKVEGNSTPTVARIEGSRLAPGSTFTKATEITRVGTGETIVFIGSFIYQRLTTPFPTILFEVKNGARLVIDTSLIEVGGLGTDGFVVSNGGVVDIVYCAIAGANRGLYVPNEGSAPIVHSSDLILRDCQQDVLIQHPGTTGNFSGAADSEKVTIDPLAPISVVYKDIQNGGLSVSGAFRLGKRQDTLTDVLDLIESTPTMGLIDGGELTDAGGLNIDVASGFGYVMEGDFPEHVLKKFEWPSQSLSLVSNQDLYVYFNTSGILTTSPLYPDTTSNIVLGRVVTGSSSIRIIDNIAMNAHHYGNKLDLLFREAFGPLYASGSLVSENTTPFKLDITSGVYFLSGKRITPSSETALTFTQVYRNGVGGFVEVDTDTVNSTHYDDGSGTLQSLSAGFFAKHYLYVTGTGPNVKYYLVISQEQYPSLAAAQTGASPLPPTFFRGATVSVAAVIVEEGTSNINTILDVRPALGFKAESLSSTSDHGSLSGLADDDHPQYLLTNGARSMSGALNMGSNPINNVGTVDGVDVSDHRNRHLPNGSDPLTTAAPTTTLSGTTSNTTGIANSLSRSDHTHAIANATTSVAGLMTSSDKTKLNGIEANAKDDQLATEVPYDNSTSSLAATHVQGAIDEVEGRVDTAETNISNLQSDKQDISEKGQANGYASLNSSGKVPTSQLPNAIMEYQGTWNADTNTPTLANGSGNNDPENIGDVYRVNNAGTTDFGSGPISFEVGDYVILDATFIWEKADTTDAVSSIFGRQGAVTAQAGDYDDVQVDYTRDDLDKKSILAASDNVGAAINDLDDNKLARSGTQAMTGNLDMGANNVINVGTVDGVDVSAHASRHLPSGADPLATAAPTTLNPDQANAEGTANSFSRSDHVHNIPAADAITSSSDANTEGTSSSFARADHTHKITQNTPTAGQLVRWDGTNWNPYSPIVTYQEEETDESTSSTSFQESFKATFNIPATGTYYIEWYFEIYNETSTRATQGRVQLDDSTILGTHTAMLDDTRFTIPVERWSSSGGSRRMNLTVGSHFVDFDFRSSEAGRISHIRSKRLTVKRLE